MRTNRNHRKKQPILLIVIDYLWLGMAIFTFVAAMIKFNQGEPGKMYAWVYLILSLLCLIIFFLKMYIRKQNRRKR